MYRCEPIIGFLLLTASLGPLASLAHSAQWRLDYEMSAVHRQQGSGALAISNPDETASTRSQKLDLMLSDRGFTVIPGLRQEGEEPVRFDLREAYLDTRLAGLEWSIGRKVLEWDYGFLSRPLSWLGPNQEGAEYSAETLLLAEHYQGMTVWQAGCTVRLYDADELCLVRVEGFSGPVDWQMLGGYEAGWRFGAGGQWIATDALALRLTGSWVQNQQQLGWSANASEAPFYSSTPLHQQEASGFSWNLGTTLTLPMNVELMAEHSWDESGLSHKSWQQIRDQVVQLNDEAASDPGLYAQNLGWLSAAAGREPLSEHRTLLRAQYQPADWQLEALALLLWTDTRPDRIDQLRLTYTALPLADLELRWRHYPRDSILGELGQEWRFSLQVSTGG